MLNRNALDEPASSHRSRQGDSTDSRRRGRRELLTLFPLLAAGCAGCGPRAPAATAARAAPPPAPLASLMDRVVVHVIDTAGNLSPRSRVPAEVRLGDLVLHHGHACDGLMLAARGIAFGLENLFDGGPADRTDIAVATNGSVCYGDVAEYLTGARHRYGSMVVDAGLGDEWVILRRATGTAVRVALRAGVKPAVIGEKEAALRAGACPPDLIAQVESFQHELARRVWAARPEDIYTIARAGYPYDPGKLRADVGKRDCPPPGSAG